MRPEGLAVGLAVGLEVGLTVWNRRREVEGYRIALGQEGYQIHRHHLWLAREGEVEEEVEGC